MTCPQGPWKLDKMQDWPVGWNFKDCHGTYYNKMQIIVNYYVLVNREGFVQQKRHLRLLEIGGQIHFLVFLGLINFMSTLSPRDISFLGNEHVS